MNNNVYRHVSLRNKDSLDTISFLLEHPALKFDIEEIKYVFGFTTDMCPMYGGRELRKRFLNLKDNELEELYKLGITYLINLTNLFKNPGDFEACRPLLEKHHRSGNGVIITRDDFAIWIKKNYPKYKRVSSVVKNNCSIRYLKWCIKSKLYDFYVLPPWCSVWYDHLLRIPVDVRKNVILFGCCSCQSNCPLQGCQIKISKMYKGSNDKVRGCHKTQILGYKHTKNLITHYNTTPLVDMGFRHFKYVDC